MFQSFICLLIHSFVFLLCPSLCVLGIIQDFAQIHNFLCALGIALFHEFIGFALAFGQCAIVVLLLNFEGNRKQFLLQLAQGFLRLIPLFACPQKDGVCHRIGSRSFRVQICSLTRLILLFQALKINIFRPHRNVFQRQKLLSVNRYRRFLQFNRHIQLHELHLQQQRQLDRINMRVSFKIVSELFVQLIHKLQHALIRSIALSLPEAGQDCRCAGALKPFVCLAEFLYGILSCFVVKQHQKNIRLSDFLVVFLLLAPFDHCRVFILAFIQLDVYAAVYINIIEHSDIVAYFLSIQAQLV